MTVFDLVIIGIVIYVLFEFSRTRRRIAVPGFGAGMAAIIFGLVAVVAFYLADLATMHILPRFVSTSTAITVMRDLNLNHRWFVTLIGVGSIAVGLAVTSRAIARLIGDLRASEHDLRTARDRALSTGEAKSQFLANMSHELRTPLNTIIGFSETMKDEIFGPVGSERYREYAADINRSGSQLLSLVDDILDLGKVEAGTVDLDEETVDVARVIEDVLELFDDRAATRSIRLTADIPASIPALRADAGRLRQILTNVLSNAIKFTSPGGHVDLLCTCDPTTGHLFQVSDTGLGIAEVDIPLALSVFGQIRHALTNYQDGTGLGLPLVNRLVELHGGTLDLTSTVDIGTTVTITFPPDRIVVPTALPQTA